MERRNVSAGKSVKNNSLAHVMALSCQDMFHRRAAQFLLISAIRIVSIGCNAGVDFGRTKS